METELIYSQKGLTEVLSSNQQMALCMQQVQ